MGTEPVSRSLRRLGTCLLAALAPLVAQAQGGGPEVLQRLGLLDARSAWLRYGASGAAGEPSSGYLLSLLPQPALASVCCWRNAERVIVPGGSEALLAMIWPESPDGAETLSPMPAMPTRTAAEQMPSVGLWLAVPARVQRLNAQTLVLHWRDAAAPVRVQHCLGDEGLRVQLQNLRSGASRGWYLPLGYDIEAPPERRCTF